MTLTVRKLPLLSRLILLLLLLLLAMVVILLRVWLVAGRRLLCLGWHVNFLFPLFFFAFPYRGSNRSSGHASFRVAHPLNIRPWCTSRQ